MITNVINRHMIVLKIILKIHSDEAIITKHYINRNSRSLLLPMQ